MPLPLRILPFLYAATVLLLAEGVAAEQTRPAPDPASLPAPLRVVVPRLTGALFIDGELDEPVWSRAAVVGPFTRADGKGAAREETLVRL